jgi:hypothetical protein
VSQLVYDYIDFGNVIVTYDYVRDIISDYETKCISLGVSSEFESRLPESIQGSKRRAKDFKKKISQDFVDACQNAGIIETSDTRYTLS